MRTPTPIFAVHASAPPPAMKRGIVLTPPTGRQGRCAWLFGALSLTPAELDSNWLLELSVTAISRTDQIPQIAPLCQLSAFHRPPRWRAEARGLARVTFAVDLEHVFRYPLRPESAYVHVSVRELCSEVVVVDARQAASDPARDFAASEDTMTFQVNSRLERGRQLIEAYTAARDPDLTTAVDRFEAVLADRQVREDLDACHLYNGACVLARAGWRGRALEWLREDCRRRVAAHTQAVASWLATDLAVDAQAAARHQLETAMREHFHALECDPDLDSLGDAREVAALVHDGA